MSPEKADQAEAKDFKEHHVIEKEKKNLKLYFTVYITFQKSFWSL